MNKTLAQQSKSSGKVLQIPSTNDFWRHEHQLNQEKPSIIQTNPKQQDLFDFTLGGFHCVERFHKGWPFLKCFFLFKEEMGVIVVAQVLGLWAVLYLSVEHQGPCASAFLR